jgi:hypothetical protein
MARTATRKRVKRRRLKPTRLQDSCPGYRAIRSVAKKARRWARAVSPTRSHTSFPHGGAPKRRSPATKEGRGAKAKAKPVRERVWATR